VIASLEVTAERRESGFVLTAHFATPTPRIGVDLARYVVAGLNAQLAGDEDWDAEEPLWELQRRRRAQAAPLRLLQLLAHARARGVPAFLLEDALQIGYGVRGWRVGAGASADELVPWDHLGPIPVLAISGGLGRDAAARRIAAALEAQGLAMGLAESATFEATRAMLGDATRDAAVVSLDPADLARRGLGVERCAASAVVSLPESVPGFAEPDELARALGVPMLVTEPEGCVALNADEPPIAALAEHAPCRVFIFSAQGGNPLVAAQIARGGVAVLARAGVIFAAASAGERRLAAAPADEAELPGALAAAALLQGLELRH
jgi:hypothetical protein